MSRKRRYVMLLRSISPWHVARIDDLLPPEWWQQNPRSWYFNTLGLASWEEHRLRKFHDAAKQLFDDWDWEIKPQIDEWVRETESLDDPCQIMARIARMRDVMRDVFAERNKPSRETWLAKASMAEAILEDIVFGTTARLRRRAVQRLLEGTLSVERGRALLEQVDRELEAGRSTLEEHREYVAALDHATAREGRMLASKGAA